MTTLVEWQELSERREAMSAVLRGFIRDGRVEVAEPIDLPDGTAVVVAPETTNRDDDPMSPEEIARILAAMQRLQPLDIPDDTAADLDAWERKLNQHGIDHTDATAESVFR
jgi:hypothetical protein